MDKKRKALIIGLVASGFLLNQWGWKTLLEEARRNNLYMHERDEQWRRLGAKMYETARLFGPSTEVAEIDNMITDMKFHTMIAGFKPENPAGGNSA